MADALLKEEQRWTYRDYREWDLDERERYEIIYGVAYAMSAPKDRHQAILVALAAKFYNFLEGKPCKARPAPYDVRLFYTEDESDDTVVQPDLTVICDEKKRGPEGCRGTPDRTCCRVLQSPSGRCSLNRSGAWLAPCAPC
jgi:Uma2 family endonuclease